MRFTDGFFMYQKMRGYYGRFGISLHGACIEVSQCLRCRIPTMDRGFLAARYGQEKGSVSSRGVVFNTNETHPSWRTFTNKDIQRFQPIIVVFGEFEDQKSPIAFRTVVTEKTWTPILIVKGVFYKSFLQSVVVYVTARHCSLSSPALPRSAVSHEWRENRDFWDTPKKVRLSLSFFLTERLCFELTVVVSALATAS